MKELLLGNEAVARGLYEGGCRVVSSYPGTPSTEITEYAATYDVMTCEWAPNEKVAMEVAGGAAIAGARSFCGMKHVGLNVAADPLFTLSYTGVNAGLVIAGKSMDDTLVEVVELPRDQHPWFLACQAHPEFLSTPRGGHPLFIGFIRAAREKKAGGKLLQEARA